MLCEQLVTTAHRHLLDDLNGILSDGDRGCRVFPGDNKAIALHQGDEAGRRKRWAPHLHYTPVTPTLIHDTTLVGSKQVHLQGLDSERYRPILKIS